MQSSLSTQTHLQHSGKPWQGMQKTLHRQLAAFDAAWCCCQKMAACRQRTSCMALAAQQPVQQSEDEAVARQNFLNHSGQSGAPAEQQAIDLLTRAAKEQKVPGQLVVGALSHIENSSPSNGADAVDALQGRWRLVFGSKAPASFLQYIPVYEVADIDKTTSTIDLSSDIGPLKFRFLGSFDWEPPSTMLFAFKELRVTLGQQQQVYNKSWEVAAGSRKEYRFFFVNEEISAVRSSAGGYVLMLKEQRIGTQASD